VTNQYYTPSGNPASHSKGLSALVRGEFTSLQAAFDAVEGIIGSGATTENARALAAEALLAPLASPHLTGIPTAPTSENGVSGTQIATTAFVLTTRPEQLATPTGDFSMGNNKITNLATPAAATDAATKNYVDGLGTGMQIKPTADAATTTALPANNYANGTAGVGATLTATGVGILTVDGIALALNNVVLVKNESAQANNGLYTVTTAGTAGVAYVLTRHTSMDQAAEFTGAFVPIHSGGGTNANTNWLCNPTGAVTVGTTAITFSQMNSATSLTGGANIQVAGNLISVISSPALTGNPTAPTRVTDDSTNSIATTAFVAGQASNAAPLMDGSGVPGVSLRYSRGDHTHPTDLSLYPASNPSGFQTAAQIGDALNGKQDALGFTPIQQGGGTDQTTSKLYIGWSGLALKCQVAGLDLGAIPSTNFPSGFAKSADVLSTYMPRSGGNFSGPIGATSGGFSGSVTISGSTVGSVSGAAYLASTGVGLGSTGPVNFSLNCARVVVAFAYYAMSDERAKTEIRDVSDQEALDWVINGRPRHFVMDGKQTAGFVAQEDISRGRHIAVAQVPSEDERYAKGDGYAMDSHKLVRDHNPDLAFLTKALQVALGRIAALEARGT
jgi:hypothetical protein